MDAKIEIRPQPGRQEQFLSSPADIAIYGGAAGGGKSFGLLIEPLRHIHNPRFGCVIFRREMTQVTKEGGLWDESSAIYPLLGALPRQDKHNWRFPSKAKIGFGHLEREETKITWHGSQIPLMEFDELTMFTKSQFFYMMSRNRSTCGVRPYIRASCNPDPDSFVADLISWYIDQESGYAIPARSGKIRYFVRLSDDLLDWADSREELIKRHTGSKTFKPEFIKSFTFVASSVYDNKILLQRNPEYLGNLNALPLVERERLLGGNWKIRPAAGLYFQRRYFEIVPARPAQVKRRVRHWDLAATEPEEGKEPDWTVGLLLSVDEKDQYYIEDVVRFQGSPNKVEDAIKNTAARDGKDVIVSLPQDPGQAGKSQVKYLTGKLSGYVVEVSRETGSKITRAGAVSSQAEMNNVKIVRAPWNEALLAELENFPRPSCKDDQVDALSGAFDCILNAPMFYFKM